MLFDIRTYTCKPGMLKKHLQLYEEHGLAPQSKCLGAPFGYFVGETGNPNQYIHIWKYENAGDREARRAAMWADPDWLTYVAKSSELGALEKQENMLMNDVWFWKP
ncbi:MAG: NIPSNAP family protein [Rhodospirillaceae bacterium]